MRNYNKASNFIKKRPITIQSFDLDETKEIPEDVLKNLSKRETRAPKNILNDFFEIQNILSIDEIIIAMWNTYEVKVTRSWVIQKTDELRKLGLVKPSVNKSGIYEYAG